MKKEKFEPVYIETPEVVERLHEPTHVSKPEKVEAFLYDGDINHAIKKLGFVTSIGKDLNFVTPSLIGHVKGKQTNVSIGDFVSISASGDVSAIEAENFLANHNSI